MYISAQLLLTGLTSKWKIKCKSTQTGLRSSLISIQQKIGVDTILDLNLLVWLVRLFSSQTHQFMYLRRGCFPWVCHAQQCIAQQLKHIQSAAVLWVKTLWMKEKPPVREKVWEDGHPYTRTVYVKKTQQFTRQHCKVHLRAQNSLNLDMAVLL